MKTITYKVARNNGQVTTVTIPENHSESTGVNAIGLIIAGALLLSLVGFAFLLLRIL
jgi:hypothetical protein